MFGWLNRARSHDEPPKPFRHLVPGWHYRVVCGFDDHDRIAHPVGETWTFVRSTFLPYEDGLSLFVSRASGTEQQIRLQWRAEAEGPIIDALDHYIMPTPSKAGRCALLLTRGSVCMADDIEAPHAFPIEVERDADAAALAAAILDAKYLAWVGSKATWSLALGKDRVVFVYYWARRFVQRVAPETFTARDCDVDRVHVSYRAQADPAGIIARMT